MEQNTDTFPALEQIVRPAFLVKDGIITAANTPAKLRQFLPGLNICDMLETGADEYADLQDGQLSLMLRCNDIYYDTTLIRQGQETLFVLAPEFSQPELKALSLAAQHLREPLSNAMNNADLLLPSDTIQADPVLYEKILQINRSLYQLQRAISNMSDCAKLQQGTDVLSELRDAVQILEEILEKACAMLSASGISLKYSLPKEVIYTQVNAAILERGILNLISNAAKQSDCGAEITVTVSKTKDNICILVENTASNLSMQLQRNLFDRYLRQPDIEDGRAGIGLGLSIVRGAAYQHGGTVLTQIKDRSFRITFSVRIRSSSQNNLRTPVQLFYDYAGGRDHTLLELSDILSAELYNQ